MSSAPAELSLPCSDADRARAVAEPAAVVSAEADARQARAVGVVAGAEPASVVGAIWPLLLTVFVCQIPIPASAIFVGVLANDFGVEATVIGGLRGIGGIAALAIGFLAAPLLDRVPRGW